MLLLLVVTLRLFAGEECLEASGRKKGGVSYDLFYWLEMECRLAESSSSSRTAHYRQGWPPLVQHLVLEASCSDFDGGVFGAGSLTSLHPLPVGCWRGVEGWWAGLVLGISCFFLGCQPSDDVVIRLVCRCFIRGLDDAVLFTFGFT